MLQDYVDAFEKLMRLKLKDKQTREIIHVLMDCSLQVFQNQMSMVLQLVGCAGYLIRCVVLYVPEVFLLQP